MRAAGQADCFVVVNGPEDGAEFPIVRAPFHIGHDGGCAVTLRLDKGIEDFHALVSVVSDGYRIRKARDKAIYVDGYPAGTLRSRIVRDGGMVQIGQTLLILDCSPDGLARRAHGISTDSDIVWAASEGFAHIAKLVKGTARFVFNIVRRIVTSWTAMVAIAFLLYVFYVPFRWRVQWVLQWAWLHITSLF
ncbi:MAG: hypothetical protein IT366_11195 [Candidatus Hydrogenedentes bacterium]|nr:hypothetical protein [Candidatus Hydrogenedentota bacterium]